MVKEDTPMTPTTDTLILNTPAHRLRARRVDESALAERARAEAQAEHTWSIRAIHGGGVANSYGYPADTEAAVAVADPEGRTVVFMARLRANKVTTAGAANCCLAGVRPLFDDRYRDEARIEAARLLVQCTARIELIVRTAPGSVIAALGGRAALEQLTLAELDAILAEVGA
jgi:hypothetical protein